MGKGQETTYRHRSRSGSPIHPYPCVLEVLDGLGARPTHPHVHGADDDDDDERCRASNYPLHCRAVVSGRRRSPKSGDDNFHCIGAPPRTRHMSYPGYSGPLRFHFGGVSGSGSYLRPLKGQYWSG